MNNPFSVGKQIYLRGIEAEDLPAMVGWINDEEVNKLMFVGHRPANLDLLVAQWRTETQSHDNMPFAVCLRADDVFIGTGGLYGINWIMRSGEMRIFLGDKSHWGQGIGTEVIKLLVVYGFERLNLNRLWLGVNLENKSAVRVYEKAGFVNEGILRQEQYRNFRYYDVQRMSILREEYAAKQGEFKV